MSGPVQRGYLQRLAATAAQGQPRVHPFAATRFPSTRFDSAHGLQANSSSLSLESSSEIVVPAPPTSRARTHPSSEPRYPGAVDTGASIPPTHAAAAHVDALPAAEARPHSPLVPSPPPSALSATAAARAQPAAPGTFQALLPGQGIATPLVAPTIVSSAQNPGTVAEAQASVRSTPPSARTGVNAASPATSAPRPWSFTPIVAAILPDSSAMGGQAGNNGPQSRLASRRDPPLAISATPSRRPLAAAVKPQRSQSASSDDIQIHIGRIEVIAVPPPAPRPVPVPARRSLSLDEYLQGSHGRSA